MIDPSIKLESYPCPVCGKAETRPRYSVGGFSIVACASCAMVYVNPRLRTSDLFNIYRNEYFTRGRRNDESGYENYELIASLRIKTFNKWYSDLRRFLPSQGPDACALDIGCAAGYFLDVLRENGWRHVEGIELDTRMINVPRSRGYNVSDLPLEQFAATRRYSLITLFDVLEHLPDVNNDFAKLSSMLDENGIIALVTPDCDSFQRKIFGKRWFQFKPMEHISYFSPPTLAMLAEKHGLEIIQRSSSGQFADYNFLYDRLSKYRFLFFNRLFSAVCSLFGLKKSHWYMGTGSMFAILRKKAA
jgi:2-polyprenyl-3-methyl-5-hydroxy-6-metoxy-1,4-benzoquinol methylase